MKLTRHGQALEAGADPATIAQWTSEVVTERARLELALQRLEPSDQLSKRELLQVVDELAKLSEALKKAEQRDRAEL